MSLTRVTVEPPGTAAAQLRENGDLLPSDDRWVVSELRKSTMMSTLDTTLVQHAMWYVFSVTLQSFLTEGFSEPSP
jgi:hypothetical protein